MTTTVETEIVRPGLADILKGITTKKPGALVDIYMGPYNLLIESLGKDKKLRGLMSQAVVPDLIQKMAKISKKKKEEITLDYLSYELVSRKILTKDAPPQADYPYSQTRILEMLVGIREGVKDDANLKKFEDPLLMVAIRIGNNMIGDDEVKLEDPNWVQNFSKAVNQIQDVIVRHMIYARANLIPLMGDDSIPTTPVEASSLSPAVKETRALGLGENPNPEMAAILNPALVMSKEKRGRYLRELELLSSLISPQQENNIDINWDKKLKGVFGYAGFEFSEAEDGPVVRDDDFGGGDVDDDESAYQSPRGDKPPTLEEINQELFDEIQSLRRKMLQDETESLAAWARVGVLKSKAVESEEKILQMQMQILGLDEAAIKLETTKAELEIQLAREKKEHEAALTKCVDTREEIQKFNATIVANLNDQIRILNAEKENLKKHVTLLQTTASGTPGTAKPAPAEKKKEELKTDYNLKALEYLIDYLGLDAKIPPLVAQWFELDDLTTKSDNIRANINIDLSNLIHGRESLTIRREIKTEDEHDYETPTDEDYEPIVIPLKHVAVIEAWRNLLSKEKNEEVKPTATDLIYVNVAINPENADALKKELDVKISAARKEPSGSNISTIDYTKKLKAYPNNLVHRRKQNRRGAGDRVLVW